MSAILTEQENDSRPAAVFDPRSFNASALESQVKRNAEGLAELELLVEGARCGACLAKIEGGLRRQPGVHQARLNLTTGRLTLGWDGPAARAGALAATVQDLGYRVVPFDSGRLTEAEAERQRAEGMLLRSLAVAGFAAANVMLLSVSVWSGTWDGTDGAMGPATLGLLHWFSALIALPAIAYAGRPFFYSAMAALGAGRLNMDVPISLAVLLTGGMSLFETMRGGEVVYFDSAVTLLFFLLLGRFLDHRARGQARGAATRLLALRAATATVLEADGTTCAVPAESVAPGSSVLVAAGERLAVDGTVADGRSTVDTSLITGESLPRTVAPGETVYAGTLNLDTPLKVTASAAGADTLMAEVLRLLELAEQRRARFVVLADRVAAIYAPGVHLLALVTFLAWLTFSTVGWQSALLIAVAVLIVTCPCALALAVPAVQVAASGRLYRHGILLKSATALERLAQIDTIVFDKTGTLTLGQLALEEPVETTAACRENLALAAGMAVRSRHPLARALVQACPDAPPLEGVIEHSGRGLSMASDEGEVRLGSRAWCAIEGPGDPAPELWLTRPGRPAQCFRFHDRPRADAERVIAALGERGYAVEMLSGDREAVAAGLARSLGIEAWRAECKPADKAARLAALAEQGRKVLMVGDGLNDAPSLAGAHASLSPADGLDIAQSAADAVFQGADLAPVVELLETARRAERLVYQNFSLAFLYNAVAIPLAMAGLVTPLLAALAMSTSSIAVTGNALRLVRGGSRLP